MLDTATKCRIDTVLDTFVDKVPDPKTVLIYKFMDDIDAE